MTKSIKTRLLRGATALVAGAAMLGSAAVANAKPIRIESENIIFYGDVKPSLAGEMIEKWEIYRRMVMALSGIDNPQPDPEKLTVYGFYDTQELQDFTGRRGIAGVYTRGAEGPIFLTSVNKKYTDNGFSEQVGLHEYTHHVLHALVTDGFPRWYDEGFANYLSTMEIDDEVIRIGVPSAAHLRAIEGGWAEWISPQTVLGAIDRYPSMGLKERKKGGTTSFYAQSWLYVHYLRNTPKYDGTLGKYIRLLDDPSVKPLDAFEQAHGVSVDDFHKEAVEYYKANKFSIDQYEPGETFMKVDIKANALTEEQLANERIIANLSFLNDDSAKVLKSNVKGAEKIDPDSPRVAAAYVALDGLNERYDTAIMRADAALSKNPNDKMLLRSAGQARLMATMGPAWDKAKRYERVEFKPDATAMEGVKMLERVLAQDEFDYLSIISLTNLYGKSDLEPSRTIVKSAFILEDRYMDSVNSDWGMDLANIYAKAGDWEGACRMADVVRGLNADKKKRETGNSPARLAHFDASFPGECESGAAGN